MTVLAESAEKTDDIDVQRALKAKERAEKRIQEALAGQEKVDLARARAALSRALARLKLAGHDV
jgi:F-type H+-transporting ATPase subunit epsilon